MHRFKDNIYILILYFFLFFSFFLTIQIPNKKTAAAVFLFDWI